MAEDQPSVSWYYSRTGRQEGPFDEFQFADLVQSGTVRGGDRVWRSGWPDWQYARDVAELSVTASEGVAADGATSAPVAAGRPLARDRAGDPPPDSIPVFAGAPASAVTSVTESGPSGPRSASPPELDPARARPFISGGDEDVAGRPLWESKPPQSDRRRGRLPFAGSDRRVVPAAARSPRGPLEQHSRWLAALFAVSIVVFAIGAVSSLLNFKQALDVSAGSFATEDARIAADRMNELRQWAVGWLRAIVVLWTVIGFMTWLYRAHINVRALGAEGLTDSPGWAIGWYFIPAFQLWRPYQSMTELWRASAAPFSWQQERAPRSVLAWWISVLALPLLMGAYLAVLIYLTGNAAAQDKATALIGLAGNVTALVSAVLALKLVRQIGAFQTGVAARPRSAVIA